MSTLAPTPWVAQRLARIARSQRHWQVVLVLLMALMCYLAWRPGAIKPLGSGWVDLNHLAAFGLLTVSARLGFAESRHAAWLVPLAMLVFGGVIEVGQAFVPGRTCEWSDLYADAAGVAVGMLIVSPLLRALYPRR
jgi:VanZ family protein